MAPNQSRYNYPRIERVLNDILDTPISISQRVIDRPINILTYYRGYEIVLSIEEFPNPVNTILIHPTIYFSGKQDSLVESEIYLKRDYEYLRLKSCEIKSVYNVRDLIENDKEIWDTIAHLSHEILGKIN